MSLLNLIYLKIEILGEKSEKEGKAGKEGTHKEHKEDKKDKKDKDKDKDKRELFISCDVCTIVSVHRMRSELVDGSTRMAYFLI